MLGDSKNRGFSVRRRVIPGVARPTECDFIVGGFESYLRTDHNKTTRDRSNSNDRQLTSLRTASLPIAWITTPHWDLNHKASPNDLDLVRTSHVMLNRLHVQ